MGVVCWSRRQVVSSYHYCTIHEVLKERVSSFERWCKALPSSLTPSLSPNEIEKELPPLDVLMVWHAFLLNPGSVHLLPLSKSRHLIRVPYAGGTLRTASDSPASLD